MTKAYPAIQAMLKDAGRLYPEEREELMFLLSRVEKLEAVNSDAEAFLDVLYPPSRL